MDLESNYEISRTVDFVRSRGFTRVALQFPDELLKDSTRVAKALRSELGTGVRLYVMADTAYGSCCVDEVGASHVDAECVVHYGHACMSPTSTLPAFFVFGKSPINIHACAESMHHCLLTTNKPILVLYGLEYAHALVELKTMMAESLQSSGLNSMVYFAEATCSIVNPAVCKKSDKEQHDSHNFDTNGKLHKHEDNKMIYDTDYCSNLKSDSKYALGGLSWDVQVGHQIENYLLFWIGHDNPAFANVILTFNNCEIVRFDAEKNQLLNDFSHQKKILKRRYYLVEKAKDANIVGILVGTLGVAGYLGIVNKMKELIEGVGKKSYTLVMGRPNSAKLANFPECDVFIYVSCAQTALLDSKDFLAPVITPFEAELAFSRGREWTGEYLMDFRDLMTSGTSAVASGTEEARFSFIHGGYMEDIQPQENGEKEMSLALVEATEKALNLKSHCTDSILFKGTARSGAEFFAARSYHGLNMQYENPAPQSYVIGRTGRAAGYEDEKENQGKV